MKALPPWFGNETVRSKTETCVDELVVAPQSRSKTIALKLPLGDGTSDNTVFPHVSWTAGRSATTRAIPKIPTTPNPMYLTERNEVGI
jgi:hypothetical protein